MKCRQLLIVAIVAACSGPVLAQGCAENFVVEGTPMLTAMNFRTSQIFPSVEPSRAVGRLNQAMLAEGFSGIRIDRANGALTALQETSGSGRPQTLRVVARKAGKGTKVDAVFMIQPGQVANADTIRAAMCRVVGGAQG